jgi:Probable lipoprotein LpqN
MRRVSDAQANELLAWLDQSLSPHTRSTGYDHHGWADSIWVLHAMFERPGMPGLTHQELRRQLDPDGVGERPTADDLRALFSRGLNDIDDSELEELVAAVRRSGGPGGGVVVASVDGLIDTGIPLGFVETPHGTHWRRLRWAELAQRDGRRLGADVQWPGYAWFAQSFPVGIQPPPEGSLDELTLHALIRVLERNSSPEVLADCVAYYSDVATFGRDERFVFTGDLRDVPRLLSGEHHMKATPSNLWPADKSWFVYTDADLMATKVSGSAELIAAISAEEELETLRWEPSIGTYTRLNDIDVIPVHRGDDAAPTINLPHPPGWVDAAVGEGTYAGIIYTGPEAATYTPGITATVSKLTAKHTDIQQIIDLAPGQLRSVPGFQPSNKGSAGTLAGFPAYRISGTKAIDGTAMVILQTIAVIESTGAVYLLWLYSYGLASQRDIVSAATDVVYTATEVVVGT